MKKLIIIIISILCLEIVAQNVPMNHSKYWFYRYRLRNEFLTLGLDPCGAPSGKMIPSGNRYNLAPVYEILRDANGAPIPKHDGSGDSTIFIGNHPDRGFGDGTSFIGTYMAVLASEYKLLKKNSNTPQYQIDALKEELYWLMMAYERLDRGAEASGLAPQGMSTRPCSSDENLNGFFLREDDDEFTCSKMRRNYFEKTNGTRLSIFNPRVTMGHSMASPGQKKNFDPISKYACDYNNNFHSNYSACSNEPTFIKEAACIVSKALIGEKECEADHLWNSLDQMSNLLVGFAYVVKLMGDESYQGYHFKNKAKDYCQRMGEYFDSSKDPHWTIKLPYDDRKIAGYGGRFEFGMLSYGLSRALDVIVRERWNGAKTILPTYRFTTHLRSWAPTIWMGYAYPTGSGPYNLNFSNHDYNNALTSQYAAVGNSWAEGLVPISKTLASFDISLPCVNQECQPRCLINRFWGSNNCILYDPFSCADFCKEEVNVRCYTYQMTPNFAALFRLGVGQSLANTVAAEISGAGLPISAAVVVNAALAGLQDIGVCVPLIPLPNITVNTTGLSLNEYGYQTHTELFTLEHWLLHRNGSYAHQTGNIENYLNTAPCSGPHYQPYFDPHNYPNQSDEWNNSPGINGWRVDNRFEKSNREKREYKYQNGVALGDGWDGEDHRGWPGIDYMLLHNTYYLVKGDADPNLDAYVNEHYRLISGITYPVTSSSGTGTVASPRVEHGFETLDVQNVTASSSATNLTFRAGLNVKISGNTKFAAGSTVKVHTKYEYPCDVTGTGKYEGFSYASDGASLRTQSVAQEAESYPDVLDTAAQLQSYQNMLVSEFTTELHRVSDTLAMVVQQANSTNFYQSIPEFVQKNPASSAYYPSAHEGISSISPNPTTGPTTVQVYNTATTTATLSIYDSFGLLKASFTQALPYGSYAWNINLSGLTPGLYNMVYQSAGVYNAMQFIKQ